jgi:hypothetical protein
MSSRINLAGNGERFAVQLGGHVVQCFTLDDAVSVKAANDILSRDDPTPYKPEHLERLAAVLIQYGHRGIADTLRSRPR